MSGDAKKDDHGHAKEEKKPLSKRLMGIGISILMLLVFMYFLKATFPEVLLGAAGTISDSGSALGSVGQGLTILSSGIRKFAMGVRLTLIELLNLAITAVLFGWLIMIVVDYAPGKKKKDSAGHGEKKEEHH